MGLVDQWKKLKHANVVTLRQVFTSKAFGDHSIIFVYDFYAGAQTLMSKYLNSSPKAGNAYMDPYRYIDILLAMFNLFILDNLVFFS